MELPALPQFPDSAAPIDRAQVSAALLVLAASISVNIGAALAKGLFPMVGSEGVAMLRTMFGVVMLWALVRPWRAVLDRGQLARLAAYGCTLGAMNLSIYWAIARIPLGLAVAIEISGPLLLVLALSRRGADFLWLGLAVAGLALLVPWSPAGRVGEGSLDPWGVAFAMLAGLFWALYIVLGRQVRDIASGTSVAVGMAFACLVTVPFGVMHAGTALLDPAIVPLGLGVALLSSLLPYVLDMKAMMRLDARVFGLITSSAPAVAALAGFAVQGERLTPLQWLAVALMMGASAGVALTSRRPPEPAPTAVT